MHRAQPVLELRRVLAMLEIFEQAASGPFLAMGQRVEYTMVLEQARDHREAVLEAVFRSEGVHIRSSHGRPAGDERRNSRVNRKGDCLGESSRRGGGPLLDAAIVPSVHQGG